MKPAQSNTKSRKTTKARQHTGGTFEALESRQMMDASPMVIGTDGNDVITVTVAQPTFAMARAFKVGNLAGGVIGTTSSLVTVNINGSVSTRDVPLTQRIQIFGGNGDDKITVVGSRGMDLVGNAGNDTLVGGTGADLFYGGAGFDTVDYSSRMTSVVLTNDDRADDGAGGEHDNIMSDIEQMNGSQADDYIASWNSNTSVYINGNLGNDKLFGGNAGDVITGGAGNDYILGNGGNDICNGGAGDDTIHGGEGKDIVSGAAGMDVLFADAGNDGVYGGDDNDRLYSGRDNDYLDGQKGDDVLVSIGGSQSDQLTGGPGIDNFWCDGESSEKVNSDSNESLYIHRVFGFQPLKVMNQPAGTPSRELLGQNLPDPHVDSTYNSTGMKNFSNVPLYAAYGPTGGDVQQNQIGDCYYLATLSAIARTQWRAIQRSVVDLGDGTYAVQFKNGSTNNFVRVDADLPMIGNTQLGTRIGSKNVLWVAIMEKAFAFYRGSGFGSYYSIGNGGQPSEVYPLFGVNPTIAPKANLNVNSMVSTMQNALSSGNAVTIGTRPGATSVVERHVYVVCGVTTVNGQTMVQLRNPWGEEYSDPARDATNDGYVTVAASRLFNDIQNVFYGKPTA